MGIPFVPVVYGMPADRPDEDDTRAVAEIIAATLARLGYQSETIAVDLDLGVLERIARRRPLAVFNLIEALRGDGRLAPMALAVLDHLGLPHTGAGADEYFRSNSKLLAKELMTTSGLPTPGWWTIGDDIPPTRRVIVKAVDEHASLGIDAGSVVPGSDAPREIVDRERRFAMRFFAEEFVDGREFNVSIIEETAGPRVLPIPEMTFDGLPDERPRIVDYDAKWLAGTEAYEHTQRRFGLQKSEPGLAARLERLSLACWRCFGLSGYARIDFRVGSDGRPTIIDVNANPCLAPDAGFMMTAAEAGLSYAAVIGAIVDAALIDTPQAA